MVRLLSLPLIITSSTSLLLGIFFFMLRWRLKGRHSKAVNHYTVFTLLALVSGTFLGAFAVLLNSGDNLDRLDIANRITIVTAMFTILLAVEFFVRFFDYRPPVPLIWCYIISGLFALLSVVPSPYFLDKAFLKTSRYYTGLRFGFLFQIWGVWIVLMSLFAILILFLVYRRMRNDGDKHSRKPVVALLSTTTIWLITGIADDLTGVQVIDLPPMTWVGSFLITGCIAWILVLQIDTLYEDRQRLNRQLIRDHLTGLFSRSFFEVRLSDAIEDLKRGKISGICICILDVDDFKRINDTYGHTIGDCVLKGIAEATLACVRNSDCAARLGGDEFAILLPGVPRDPVAADIVKRIQAGIRERAFQCDGEPFDVSCSFGLARAGPEHLVDGDLAKLLISGADSALYESKRSGKDAVTAFTLPPCHPAEMEYEGAKGQRPPLDI